MLTERVQQVLQQIAALDADEKQSLVEYLKEQERQDAEAASKTGSEQREPDPLRRREYEWLRQHRDEYAGQYVVVEGDCLIAHGTDGRRVLAEARQAGTRFLLS